MRAVLSATGAGLALILAGCGAAAPSHPVGHAAAPDAGPPPATIPATPAPDLTFTCRVGWIDTSAVNVPWAGQQPPPAGGFLPDTRASLATAAEAEPADVTGFLVTVTNHTAAVIPVGAVSVQPLATGSHTRGR